MTAQARLTTSRRALILWWAATAFASIAATLMIAAPAQAAVPAPALDAAFQSFQRASASNDTATIEAAAEQFARLSAADPADPVLLAYGGAAIAMRANTTALPWRKLSFADEGLAQVDKALTMLNAGHDTPLHRGIAASLDTRFVAATTFLRMPAMLNRHARGARLLDEVLKSPLFAGAPVGFRAAVWMRAADEATKDKRNDEARQWLNLVAASGASQAASAQAKLKELAP